MQAHIVGEGPNRTLGAHTFETWYSFLQVTSQALFCFALLVCICVCVHVCCACMRVHVSMCSRAK